jgi:hypothetical protein
MLLVVRVVERPVVLAPLALRATGTLNAGRGAKARRARRRVRRLRLAELVLLPGLHTRLAPQPPVPRRALGVVADQSQASSYLIQVDAAHHGQRWNPSLGRLSCRGDRSGREPAQGAKLGCCFVAQIW